MRVFLTGVGCVGKTTIGLRFAELMGLGFFDLDTEIELFYFKKSYTRADLKVSIEGMDVEQAAHHILVQLKGLRFVMFCDPGATAEPL